MGRLTDRTREDLAANKLAAKHVAKLRAICAAEDVRRALHCDLPFFAASHTETVPPVGPARESAQ
ncbi:MAG: hypothetical protein EKK55_20115 [Rhodocyclaceae bacterium]|nr:MAG: hypothetical protein EKK55_20115 [Rhodocyclaceae bacterium]